MQIASQKKSSKKRFKIAHYDSDTMSMKAKPEGLTRLHPIDKDKIRRQVRSKQQSLIPMLPSASAMCLRELSKPTNLRPIPEDSNVEDGVSEWQQLPQLSQNSSLAVEEPSIVDTYSVQFQCIKYKYWESIMTLRMELMKMMATSESNSDKSRKASAFLAQINKLVLFLENEPSDAKNTADNTARCVYLERMEAQIQAQVLPMLARLENHTTV